MDAGEAGCGHADDLERMATEGDGTADRVGTSSVLALPEAVTQYRHARTAAHVVGGLQHPTSDGGHAEHVEVIAAHPGAGGAPHRATGRQVECRIEEGEGTGERVLPVADMLPLYIGERDAAFAHGQLHDFLGVLHGERAQHDRVDQAEDRRVGPDPESERQHRDQGKPGIRTERPRRIA